MVSAKFAFCSVLYASAFSNGKNFPSPYPYIPNPFPPSLTKDVLVEDISLEEDDFGFRGQPREIIVGQRP
jgi:hypothetical protein